MEAIASKAGKKTKKCILTVAFIILSNLRDRIEPDHEGQNKLKWSSLWK